MADIDSYQTIEGVSLQDTNQIYSNEPVFALPGTNGFIPIDKNLLSKHILLMGGIGMGKTNTINYLVRNIRSIMTQNDVMVIFDPKRDYYHEFYKEGDIVISNDEIANVYWNIFNEILIDDRIEENINEVASYFYKERMEHSSNPFFPSAAKDVFAALLQYIINIKADSLMNNESLRKIIDTKTAEDYIRYFDRYNATRGVNSYIGQDAKGQAQGVLSEFKQTLREVFIGNFKKKGDFSIRKAIQKRGGKAIFIEYDLGLGHTLAPIYTLLLDLAIKEALCRAEGEKGDVYFIMDEFRLLNPLSHMDNGINFGRSRGAKFILGLQNADQMYDVYGETAGRSILSGCSTLIAFRVADRNSRELIKERGGANIKILTRRSQVSSRGIMEQTMNANSIEDWDIGLLNIGEAIVQSGNSLPFKFTFRRYV